MPTVTSRNALLTDAHARPVVWITGAGGLIGSHLVRSPFAPADWCIVPLLRADLDLTDHSALTQRFRCESPDLVIHCAALSRSGDCEADPARARRLNLDVTAQLADLCADRRLIFLSTDLVFDGRQGDYRETDAVNPLGVYAETKVAAEQVVLAHPRYLVLRTSLNAGDSPTGDRGLDELMRRAWRNGQTLRLFTDEFRCPIPAEFTARAIWELVRHNITGLYHLAGAERLSRWQIGELLAAWCPELQPRLERASLREHNGAQRPPDTSLNSAKAQALLSFPLPRFSGWLTAKHRPA